MAKSNIYKRNIKREHLNSMFLQTDKEILISYPLEVVEGKRYPVLLLHDGNDYFQMGRLITLTNQLIAENRLQPLVMVAIPVDKKRRNQEYSPLGKYHHAHLQFLAEELLPHLISHHPILPSVDERVIAGSSLGGTAALHFALHYPESCHRVFTQSGAFFKETLELIAESKNIDHMQIYQSVGLMETALQTENLGQVDLVARNREVYEALQQQNIDVKLVEREGDHTWGLWQKDLPNAMQHFFA